MMLHLDLSSTRCEAMASFGTNLKREREMRGVPLEEIAAATKISIRCLQALEAGEFSKLPGGIFTRSFLRSYARYLGLDEEKVMAEFQALAPRAEEADLSKLSPSITPKEPRPNSRTPALLLLLAVVVLAGGFFLYSSYRQRVAADQATRGIQVTSVQPQPATTSTTPVTPPAGTIPAQATSATATQATTSSTAPGELSSAAPTKPATEPALTLQIAATDQTWIAIDADGKTAWQGILKPNEIQTFKAQASFDLRTGNAQGIILTLNGETLKPLGGHGEFKKVHLTQSDLKSPSP